MIEFKMPDIGEGVAEGEVVKWLVKEGDAVQDDQPLVEVMTDKATVVIPSPTKGVVRSILVGEGKTARVGSAIVTFAQEGEGEAAAAPAPAPAAPQAPAEAPAPPASPYRAEPSRAEKMEAPARPDNGRTGPPPAPVAPTAAGGRVLAAPATRKMAREAGVDLGEVRGTGPGGRITRDDLERYLQAGPAAETVAPSRPAPPEEWPGEVAPPPALERAAAPAAPPARLAAAPVAFAPGPRPETRVPMKGIRRRIAENMRRSKDRAAHFTYVEECDMTELTHLRESVAALAQERGVRLTYLPFIIKAVVSGLRKFPHLNSSYDEETQEIVLKGYYNIGIAASNGEDLMVPVLRDADRLSIMDLASELHRLGEGARKGTLTRDELTGSTFTITSLGKLGGLLSTPVINYPEVAILGVPRIRKRPVVRDDQVVIRDMCYLSISIDHRVVDGQMGAEFVEHVVRLLEEPRMLLLS